MLRNPKSDGLRVSAADVAIEEVNNGAVRQLGVIPINEKVLSILGKKGVQITKAEMLSLLPESTSYVKPIQTTYKGYRFRSRLEARYAIYFDALGPQWVYEPEGFELPNGERYLPDFYFPQIDMYGEVKPGDFVDDKRHELFVKGTGKTLFVFCGQPGDNKDVMISIEDGSLKKTKGRALASWAFDMRKVAFLEEKEGFRGNHPAFKYAIECVRAARFEFGETSKPVCWYSGARSRVDQNTTA